MGIFSSFFFFSWQKWASVTRYSILTNTQSPAIKIGIMKEKRCICTKKVFVIKKLVCQVLYY